MKVTVKKVFRDIYTKDVYSIDDVIEVTEERLDEIHLNLGGDFVEVVEEVPEFPKFVKRGTYELSNGEQIKASKEEAVKAEEVLRAE